MSPINHGETSDATFLSNACLAAKKLMDRDPEKINFTLIALGKRDENDE